MPKDHAEIIMDSIFAVLPDLKPTPSPVPHLEDDDELDRLWRELGKAKDGHE